MSGSTRSGIRHITLVMAAGLLLIVTCVAVPAFVHGQASAVPFGSVAFAAQWSSIEPTVPNFWGPAVQSAIHEPYREATSGTRLVQYFDKARMEQTMAGGAVTNGLLTVELITGQRQMGDQAFAPFPPSTVPVVGDPSNTWPPYAALANTIFPEHVAKSGDPVGTVYKPDGSFALDPSLAAQPGAAYGEYQSDPGGKYGHNIPLAFWSYLTALPVPWQTTMGFPLTEPFWVQVTVNNVPATWVLVQPFERRVLSYTPSNPAGFQVEMGNIGQHYFQWRYPATSTPTGTPAASGTAAATSMIATATATSTNPVATRTIAVASHTPVPLAITSVQLGTATESTASVTFATSIAATTEILYGTTSHSYAFRQDISTTATQDHTANLTGLQPGTRYYFALRATANGTSVQRNEDYFATPDTTINQPIAIAPTATKVSLSATPLPTATPIPSPTSTTVVPKMLSVTVTQATLAANNPVKLAPTAVQLGSATIALSLAYDGAAGGSMNTLRPTTWSSVANGLSASSTDALPPLKLLDKQSTIVITAAITIPRANAGDTPLTFSYTRKMLASDYNAGITFTTSPISSAQAANYSLTLSFAVSVG